MHIFHLLNLYPNYSISKGKSTDASDDEYAYLYDHYDDYEGADDDYEYDQDYAQDYGLEAGDKFIILRMSAVPLISNFHKVN